MEAIPVDRGAGEAYRFRLFHQDGDRLKHEACAQTVRREREATPPAMEVAEGREQLATCDGNAAFEGVVDDRKPPIAWPQDTDEESRRVEREIGVQPAQ